MYLFHLIPNSVMRLFCLIINCCQWRNSIQFWGDGERSSRAERAENFLTSVPPAAWFYYLKFYNLTESREAVGGAAGSAVPSTGASMHCSGRDSTTSAWAHGT